MSFLLDLLIPKVGINQHNYRHYLCSEDITTDIQRHSIPQNHPALDTIWYIAPYKKEVRTLLHRAKYKGEWAIYEDFASIALEYIDSASLLIPVPPDPVRFAQRRYHGPYKLCSYFSKQGLHTIEALHKTTTTPPQAELNRSQRLSNNSSVFHLADKAIFPKHVESITLVDDIVTTGSTLLACAIELKKYFPNTHIEGLALAGNE